MLIRLTTLGAARIHSDDKEHSDLPAQRLRFALLLYLAVERDVSREEVLSMFWPDRDPARGRHALRQMLYELRQVLGDEWVELRRDRIVVSAVETDALAFETAVTEGRIDDAFALYGGPFLLGFTLDNHAFESWADRRRAHLGRLHRKLAREHIAALVGAGDPDAALAAARRWVEVDPLEDEAAHALIERLAAAGQRAAALQFYETYERRLAEELQVEPLDETKALVAAIRSGDVVAAPIKPAPTMAATEPTVLASSDAEPASFEGRANPPARRPIDVWHRWGAISRAAAIAIVLLPVVAILVIAARRPVPPAYSAERPVRIAVVPLTDHSPDGSLSALSATLTEALAHGLGKSQFLEIIPPRSVEILLNDGVAKDTVGRMLSADYLVGGSLQEVGDRLRLAVELIDARTSQLVESEVVERTRDDSRNLQDDVVREATTFVRGQVGDHVSIERVRASTTSQEAFDLLMEARAIEKDLSELLDKGQYAAMHAYLERADSILALAAEKDRRWAEPVVQRGWLFERRAYVARFHSNADSARRALLHQALQMADAAHDRDPSFTRTHSLRGAILHRLAYLETASTDAFRRRLTEAERVLRLATTADPNSQGAWRRLAEVLHTRGQYEEALYSARRAYTLDQYAPGAGTIVYMLYASALEAGEDKEAESWCMEGRRREPAAPPFTYCLFTLHAWVDAIPPDPVVLDRAWASFKADNPRIQPELPGRINALKAAAWARAQQPDSARALLAQGPSVPGDEGWFWIAASAYVRLGEDSTAIRLLRENVRRGNWDAPRIIRSRPFEKLRGNREYQQLVAATPPRI